MQAKQHWQATMTMPKPQVDGSPFFPAQFPSLFWNIFLFELSYMMFFSYLSWLSNKKHGCSSFLHLLQFLLCQQKYNFLKICCEVRCYMFTIISIISLLKFSSTCFYLIQAELARLLHLLFSFVSALSVVELSCYPLCQFSISAWSCPALSQLQIYLNLTGLLGKNYLLHQTVLQLSPRSCLNLM